MAKERKIYDRNLRCS